jgi:anthranilate synthase component 1
VLVPWTKAVVFGLQKTLRQIRRVRARKLAGQRDAFALFSKLHENYDSCFLLESAEPDQNLGRYSFLGFQPQATIAISENIVRTEHAGGAAQEYDFAGNPFSELRKVGVACKARSLGFLGGLVGSVSYGATKYFDSAAVAATAARESGGKENFPEMEFGLFLDGVVFDRKKNACTYVTLGEDRFQEVEKLANEPAGPREEKPAGFSVGKGNFSDAVFERKVEAAKEFVRAGDVFQVVLSRRREVRMLGGRLQFYEKLREINPSPYMYFLKFGKREIVGSSPEMLVRVEGRGVETYPIAGTRKRGSTSQKDAALGRELLADEKERAEHLMLVDLARNDVGRVAEYGSVKVPKFAEIKKFSHVQHLVSRVAGRLARGKDCFDAFASVFPAGTVSGAPKLRAMEIIAELEKCPRGPYAGSVGYFSFNGNCDFAISIRTLFANGNDAFVQAGAGIVYDSVAEREAVETDNKMAAIIAALNATKCRGDLG